MAQLPSPKAVEKADEYWHVRFRDPDEFSEIRTPDWAAAAAESVYEGSEVRTGHRPGSDEWVVQSVLIPASAERSTAESKARAILEKLEG
jgi:hypothetical protein